MDIASILSGSTYTSAIESVAATRKVDDEDESSKTTVGSGTDTVTISDAAKKLAEILANARGTSDAAAESGSESASGDGESDGSGESAQAAGGGGSGGSDSASQVEDLKKKIEELQDKILKVEQQDIPDGTKKPIVSALQAEIASLQQQIAELQAEAAKSA